MCGHEVRANGYGAGPLRCHRNRNNGGGVNCRASIPHALGRADDAAPPIVWTLLDSPVGEKNQIDWGKVTVDELTVQIEQGHLRPGCSEIDRENEF